MRIGGAGAVSIPASCYPSGQRLSLLWGRAVKLPSRSINPSGGPVLRSGDRCGQNVTRPVDNRSSTIPNACRTLNASTPLASSDGPS